MLINHFNNNVYFDGGNPRKICDTFPMPNTMDTLMTFDNNSVEYDMVLDDQKESDGINQLKMEFMIDGVYKDITTNNPLYVKILIN
jgi:hypothetical protein